MFSVLGLCLHPSLLVILVSASFFYLFFSFSGGSSLWALSGLWFGLDEVGFFLLILNKLIFLWVILSGVSESRLYSSVVFLMSNFVGGCFYLHSTIPFYAFFEASLLPMVTLVLGWGYQPERLEASKYLLVYTVFFSYPLLLSILLIELGGGGASFIEWLSSGLSQGSVMWVSGLMLLGGFLVKIPVYGIHLWLPKAHVEASGGGSMILAAVLLKLGGVGLWRVFPLLNGLGGSLMGISGWSLWGGMVVSLLCLVQSDLKLLVAYSSVSHMSLVVWGILSNGVLGSHGGLIMMVAHGFASSGLFYVSGILFKESGSRSLILNQGLLIVLPGLAMAWFLVNCLSMAVPPSINFFSEIEILIFSYSVSAWGWVSVLFMGFFSVTYSMLCYTLTSHGRASSVSRGVRALVSEHQLILFHVVASVMMIFVFSGV